MPAICKMPAKTQPNKLGTPKQVILLVQPRATLDYYEFLRNAGKPCWFIRYGLQGKPYTHICSSPRAAWKAAYDSFMAYMKKGAA